MADALEILARVESSWAGPLEALNALLAEIGAAEITEIDRWRLRNRVYEYRNSLLRARVIPADEA